MDEVNIRKYLDIGGKLFRVKDIDSYRDGGTGVITTTCGIFFIHQKNNTVHTGYPPTDDNLITYDVEKEYLIEQVQIFIDRKQEGVIRHMNLLKSINPNKKNGNS